MKREHLNTICTVAMAVGLSIASICLGISLAQQPLVILDQYSVGENDSEKLASGWYLGNHTIWEPFWSSYIPGEGDSDNARSASFTLSHKEGNAKVLRLTHVDGFADDSFDVYVNGVFVYHYTAVGGNIAVTTDVPLPANIGANVGGRTGKTYSILLRATGEASSYLPSWGQVRFEGIQLLGTGK